MTTRSRLRRIVGLGLAATVMAVGLLPAAARAAPGRSSCAVAWGSLAKSDRAMTVASVSGVRAGRHDCFDRLVVDLAGTRPPGYDVRYIDRPYRAEGSGDPLSVGDGAVLHLTVLAPAYDENGNSTVPWRGSGAVIRRFAGFRTLTELVWGGSFEGQSSFGLGVRARLPFRVFQLHGPGGGSRLVIDVAHRW